MFGKIHAQLRAVCLDQYFFYIICVIIAWMIPLQWLCALLISATVHELSHYLMIKLLGLEFYGFKIGFRGALIKMEEMLDWQQLLCAAAGPTGSLVLVLAAPWAPRLAVCGLVHGLFNLLPIYPYDGGRILMSILTIIFGKPFAIKLYYSIVQIFLFQLILLGIYIYVRYKLLPAIVLAVLAGIRLGKTPCKDAIDKLQ